MKRDAGFTAPWRFAQQGFTLIELMIALLIFGILAAAGVSLLSFGVRAQAVAGKKLDDVGALARLDAVLEADLAQTRPRPTRDINGGREAIFAGGNNGTFLRLVRGGWDNVDAAPRPSLQKVEYQLSADGTISRVAYPMLDGAPPLPPAALLSDVGSATLRYRVDGAWSDAWSATSAIPLPDAVELTITRRNGTVFRELFAVGTGTVMGPGSGNAR